MMPASRCDNPVTFHPLSYRVYSPWPRKLPVAIPGHSLSDMEARAFAMMVPRSGPRRLERGDFHPALQDRDRNR